MRIITKPKLPPPPPLPTPPPPPPPTTTTTTITTTMLGRAHFQLCCNPQTVPKEYLTSTHTHPPRWPSGKASASRAEDPGFESRLRRDFFGVESYQ